jgi:HEAT repeat protein
MTELEALLTDLQSADPDSRIAAANGLGQYGAFHEDVSGLAAAVPPLIGLLDDHVHEVRIAAAYALGAIGRQEAVPNLVEALHRSGNAQEMQLVLSKALGKLHNPAAVPALRETARTSKSQCVRVAAQKALATIEQGKI